MTKITKSDATGQVDEEVAKEAAALARLIAYAAQSARAAGLETPAYFLELALVATVEELHGCPESSNSGLEAADELGGLHLH